MNKPIIFRTRMTEEDVQVFLKALDVAAMQDDATNDTPSCIIVDDMLKQPEKCEECGYQGKTVCHICGLEDKQRSMGRILGVCEKCSNLVCFRCCESSSGEVHCDKCRL
jgi:hypothetical protein